MGKINHFGVGPGDFARRLHHANALRYRIENGGGPDDMGEFRRSEVGGAADDHIEGSHTKGVQGLGETLHVLHTSLGIDPAV
jgi:hypothetical protein